MNQSDMIVLITIVILIFIGLMACMAYFWNKNRVIAKLISEGNNAFLVKYVLKDTSQFEDYVAWQIAKKLDEDTK